jgi:hypothetical protein
MKRCGLILTTLCALFLTGLVLHKAGWLSSRAAAATPSDAPGLHAGQLLTSQAAWRYRQSQPRHWRDCMLRH